MYPHRLDLAAERAAVREAGDHGQLQRPDDGSAGRRQGREQLVRVGLDPLERGPVCGVRRPFAAASERVVGEQLDEVGQIGAARAADRELVTVQQEGVQCAHGTHRAVSNHSGKLGSGPCTPAARPFGSSQSSCRPSAVRSRK
jgi:hypothetical protein